MFEDFKNYTTTYTIMAKDSLAVFNMSKNCACIGNSTSQIGYSNYGF